MGAFSIPDLIAAGLFAFAWLFYEPLWKRFTRGPGAINTDMTLIRAAWMRAMTRRENRFMDANLMGHVLNSASFFGSSNLILIAAAAGALFGGETMWRNLSGIGLFPEAPRVLADTKLALVVVVLARGLLDFIWAIRQMNYCLAAMGAAPDFKEGEEAFRDAYADAAASILNPSLSAFSSGVRGYYFALAAAAWLFGPYPFMAATALAVLMIARRQAFSPAAKGLRRLRELLERR